MSAKSNKSTCPSELQVQRQPPIDIQPISQNVNSQNVNQKRVTGDFSKHVFAVVRNVKNAPQAILGRLKQLSAFLQARQKIFVRATSRPLSPISSKIRMDKHKRHRRQDQNPFPSMSSVMFVSPAQTAMQQSSCPFGNLRGNHRPPPLKRYNNRSTCKNLSATSQTRTLHKQTNFLLFTEIFQ